MSLPMVPKMICPTEDDEQITFVDWCHLFKIDDFFAIPNGGSRHPAEAKKLKRMGTKRGVPDIHLHIPIYPYHGLYVEMKRIEGSVISPEQKAKIARLNELGYLTLVAHGFVRASSIVKRYLRGEYAEDKAPVWVSHRVI